MLLTFIISLGSLELPLEPPGMEERGAVEEVEPTSCAKLEPPPPATAPLPATLPADIYTKMLMRLTLSAIKWQSCIFSEINISSGGSPNNSHLSEIELKNL